MRFIDEYRESSLVTGLAKRIRKLSSREIVLMEVCGGHTMAVHKFGLRGLLPETVRLISGPGCPVCVSGIGFIDKIIELVKMKGNIIATYGDLIRVPGSSSSLENEKGKGADVRFIYSVLDSLKIARENPGHTVIFPGIGFETTAPATAAAILQAQRDKLENFKVLSSHKVMPPVMKALIDEGVKINGYIAPGHVTAITGTEMFRPIVEKYGVGVVVSGFEPADILQTISMLVAQFEDHDPKVEIQYSRVVKPGGNPVARKVMEEVFEPGNDTWRGIGMIPESGLKIRSTFKAFDAEKYFSLPKIEETEPTGCICGEILKGVKTPADCKLFAGVCTPVNPVGACMVSNEGTCSAFYHYQKSEGDGR